MPFETLFFQNPDRYEYSARLDRQLVDTLFTEGLLNNVTGAVASVRSSAPLLALDIGAFRAVVQGDDIARQGKYYTVQFGTETVTFDAPPSTGSRLDRVVLEFIDSTAVALAGRPEGPRLRAIAGTVVTSGSPVAPAEPNTAITLFTVPIAAGQTTVPVPTGTNDVRPLASGQTLSVTVGTQLQTLTSTQRDALVGADRYLGRTIYNSTTAQAEFWNGTAWAPLFNTAPVVRQDFTYGADGLATILDKDAGGATVKTTTFNYTSGTLTSITETAGSRTVTTTFTYTSGNLTRIDRTVTIA